MRLHDKRLTAILDELKGCTVFADIGTDHGKLPVAAIKNGVVERAIAVDISLASLGKAKTLAEKLGICLDARHGDGLTPLKNGEVEAVVIAGMGGLEIIRIIEQRLKSFEKYILLPHKSHIELRRYLRSNDIGIINDRVVKDGKFFYHLITCTICNKWNNNHNVYVGTSNSIMDADFADYLEYRLNVVDTLIDKSGASAREDLENERKELLKWKR